MPTVLNSTRVQSRKYMWIQLLHTFCWSKQYHFLDSYVAIVVVGYTCTIVVLSPDRNCLEMVTDWPNMDVAVIMTSYGRCLFGGRPVKTENDEHPTQDQNMINISIKSYSLSIQLISRCLQWCLPRHSYTSFNQFSHHNCKQQRWTPIHHA